MLPCRVMAVKVKEESEQNSVFANRREEQLTKIVVKLVVFEKIGKM